MRVAVGILSRPDGHVLVAERDAARHAGGGLEFPGGKIESGESPGCALTRELREELGIAVTHAEPLIRVRHCYPERSVDLAVFRVEAWTGEPAGEQGQAVYWHHPRDLRAGDFPAANRPILAALQGSGMLRVTPATAGPADVEVLADRVVAGARDGDWIQVRTPGLDRRHWERLVRAIRAGVDDHAAGRVLLNTDPDDPLPRETGFGLHLNAARAARIGHRPAGAGFVSCSAHDAAELDIAERLEADLVVIGPIRPTPSHTGAPAIGFAGLVELTARTTLPVHAIGGLTPADLAHARAHGAVGVAGISAFWS